MIGFIALTHSEIFVMNISKNPLLGLAHVFILTPFCVPLKAQYSPIQFFATKISSITSRFSGRYEFDIISSGYMLVISETFILVLYFKFQKAISICLVYTQIQVPRSTKFYSKSKIELILENYRSQYQFNYIIFRFQSTTIRNYLLF